ncbi:MAG: efflux RND transporter periplasmic adaptor subunit [Kiritimatiellae bacterium]|nr:efflux RND transporter periplasmic adaptor subunit [Kiritimatiellia bacterium]
MKRTALALARALLAAAILGSSAACMKSDEAQTGGEMQPVAVRTATAAPSDIRELFEFTGDLESPLSVNLASKAAGRLDKVVLRKGQAVTEGVEVKKGQTVAEVAHDELEAQVSLAGAQVRAAEVSLADKDRERRRIEALYAENVSTEQARDAAVTAFESAQATLAQAQASLRLAQVNLDEAFVKAPMDGVVTARHLDPGAMVSSSTPILTMAQMTPLRLMLAVPARMLPMLTPGQTEVSIRLDGVGDRTFVATLSRIFPTVDTTTRTAQVEVLLDNERTPDGSWLMRPGMYATASMQIAARAGVLTVPASALIRVLDHQILFVVNADGHTVRAQTVETGLRDNDRVEIVSGLAANEEYIVMGQNKLTDGAPIERVGVASADAPEAPAAAAE